MKDKAFLGAFVGIIAFAFYADHSLNSLGDDGLWKITGYLLWPAIKAAAYVDLRWNCAYTQEFFSWQNCQRIVNLLATALSAATFAFIFVFPSLVRLVWSKLHGRYQQFACKAGW